MKTNSFLSVITFLMLTVVTSHAHAEVYKCTSSVKQSSQKSVVYSDMPCKHSVGNTQTVTQAKLKLVDSDFVTNVAAADIDLLVSRAVLNGEFTLAKSLAQTKEHWRLISLAEGRTTVSTKPIAPVIIVKNAARNECAIARNDFESTSRTKWRQKRLIAAKKSSMYAACGVVEPGQQNRPVVIGHSYGGIQSSRWVAPSYRRGAYHRPYGQHHKKHHSQHAQSKSGFSLHYKSKHFGLRAQSLSTGKHTDIRQQFRSRSMISTQLHDNIRQQFR